MADAAKKLDDNVKTIGNIVIEARVRALLEDEEGGPFRLSPEFLEALNGEVQKLVLAAATRCKLNGRQTLKPQDL